MIKKHSLNQWDYDKTQVYFSLGFIWGQYKVGMWCVCWFNHGPKAKRSVVEYFPNSLAFISFLSINSLQATSF